MLGTEHRDGKGPGPALREKLKVTYVYLPSVPCVLYPSSLGVHIYKDPNEKQSII